MRFSNIVSLGVLISTLMGCAHNVEPVSSNDKTVIAERGNLPAFRQQTEADLVIEFLDWNDLRIVRPAPSIEHFRSSVKKKDFLGVVNALRVQKRFIVVVLDKRWSISSDRVSLDELETFMRGIGFQRIVFQQAIGDFDSKTGLPILRDTAERP